MEEEEGERRGQVGGVGAIRGYVGSDFKNQAPDFFQISRVSEQTLQKKEVVFVSALI